jgi:hypothetical protein
MGFLLSMLLRQRIQRNSSSLSLQMTRPRAGFFFVGAVDFLLTRPLLGLLTPSMNRQTLIDLGYLLRNRCWHFLLKYGFSLSGVSFFGMFLLAHSIGEASFLIMVVWLLVTLILAAIGYRTILYPYERILRKVDCDRFRHKMVYTGRLSDIARFCNGIETPFLLRKITRFDYRPSSCEEFEEGEVAFVFLSDFMLAKLKF